MGKIFIVLLTLTCSEVMSYGQQSNYIYWSVDRQLKWDDYQGVIKDTAKVYDGFKAAAVSYISFGSNFGYTDDTSAIYATITARFDKEKSFAIEKSKKILEHENGHFNLAEIYARKTKRAWKELNVKDENFNTKIDSIQNVYWDSLKIMDRYYDDETFYGVFEGAQDSLLSVISNELEGLKEYADTIFFYFRKPVPVEYQRKCCK